MGISETIKNKYEIFEILFWIIFDVAPFAVFIPLYLLFVERGIVDEPSYLSKNLIYFIPLFTAVIIILGKKIGKLIIGKSQVLYDKYGWISGGMIHDPEQGLLPNWRFELFGKQRQPFGWMRNPIKLFLVSFLFFFGFVMIFGIFSNEFFVGLPAYDFQFTDVDKMLSKTYPASPSETYLFIALLSIVMDILRWGLYRLKAPKFIFWLIFILIITPAFAYGGVQFHNSRYQGQDIAQGVTGLFWGGGILLSGLTGSIIPFRIWHDENNLFKESTNLFSSDLVKAYSLIIFLILSGLSAFIYFKWIRKRKSIEESVKVESPL